MTISIENLSVHYGSHKATSDITFEAAGAQLTAIIGPNGSGKSTLVKAVAGLLTFDGAIALGRVGGQQPRVGYMPQDFGMRAALTVLEAVLLGRLGRLGLRVDSDNLGAAIAVLDEVGISSLAQRELGELSGGQRQLVFLAQALAADPQILLLDEPVSALDIRHQLDVLTLILRLTRERSLTTLCVLHDLHAASRFADRIVVLREGVLISDGSPSAVLTAETIASAYEVEAHVQDDGIGGRLIIPLRSLVRDTRL